MSSTWSTLQPLSILRLLGPGAGAALSLAASWPVLLAGQVWAAGPPAEGGDLSGGGMGEASVKMFGTLLLVVGLIVLIFYLMKRFRLTPFPGGRETRMRLHGTLPLGPRRQIALVEVCGQWLVLGVGTETISLLSRVDPPSGLEGRSAGQSSDGPSFEGVLGRLFGSRGREKGAGHEGV